MQAGAAQQRAPPPALGQGAADPIACKTGEQLGAILKPHRQGAGRRRAGGRSGGRCRHPPKGGAHGPLPCQLRPNRCEIQPAGQRVRHAAHAQDRGGRQAAHAQICRADSPPEPQPER
jgi:hypothetical protein